MKLTWSLYLGKIAGIKLFVHWTFWILVVWIFIMHYQASNSVSDGLIGVLFIFALFLCVVLHELGHSLTARRFDIQTKNITLLPIGGMASLEMMPEKPRQELLVAAAGPLVNVVIAFILYVYLKSTGGMYTLSELAEGDAAAVGITMSGSDFLFNLYVVNIALVLFNLIPAFPMDGGRMLRALLAYRMDRGKATMIAARIGQFLAIAFVFFGFFNNFWLVFIGLFIFLGAGGEAAYEATRSALGNYRVKDVLITKYSWITPDSSLGHAVQLLLDSQEQAFLVGEDNIVTGVLTRNNIIKGLDQFGKSGHVRDVMLKEFPKLDIETELKEVYRKMTTEGFEFAPVYQNGHIAGVLDRENISEFIMVESANKTNQMRFS
ncbi:MAG: site-2 protease family protein [Chitinophagales bacterium]|nr:site-2 protease family protein [Chitinophagales bacterium]